MSNREVDLETVHYNSDAMSHAMGQLIYNFGEYSGLVGKDVWFGLTAKLGKVIREELPQTVTWRTRALDIVFTGFPLPILRPYNGRLVFAAKAPRVIFAPRVEEISPSRRNHIYRVTKAISEEMAEIYRLKIDDNTLIFPKSIYAKEWNSQKGMMLV